MKDPALREAFEKVKTQLAERGLTPAIPLKRKETVMSETNETTGTEAPKKLTKKATGAPVKKTTETTGTEAPKKLTKKATGAPAKKTTEKKEPKATPVDGYTAGQLAEDLGIDAVELRKALRGIEAKKPGARWVWPKKSDTTELAKQVKAWMAEDGRLGNSGRKPAAGGAPAKKVAAKKAVAKSAPAKKAKLTKKAAK